MSKKLCVWIITTEEEMNFSPRGTDCVLVKPGRLAAAAALGLPAAVLLTATLDAREYRQLRRMTEPYTCFVTPEGEPAEMLPAWERFCRLRMPQRNVALTPEQFCALAGDLFHDRVQGQRLQPSQLEIAQTFTGTTGVEGNRALRLEGSFGENFRQIVFCREPVLLPAGQEAEIWAEFETEGSVEVRLRTAMFTGDDSGTLLSRFLAEGEGLQEPLRVENPTGQEVLLSISLQAKGEGTLKTGVIHIRPGRRGYGHLLPGARRIVDSRRQELLYYFHPGDGRGPLNVYFGGYRTAESFEGYHMLRALGAPFLLWTDPRMEGGAFYLGSAELEAKLQKVIMDTLAYLKLGPEDLVAGGLSTGSSAAFYHCIPLGAQVILAGKPIVNLGTLAANERLVRPGGFPASLDIYQELCHERGLSSMEEVDGIIKEKIAVPEGHEVLAAVSYMKQDEYDPRAYGDLLEKAEQMPLQVYAKGIRGRHNEQTGEVVSWFARQFANVMKERYGRNGKEPV